MDVLLVGNLEFGAVVSALSLVQGHLGREVNPSVHSAREFKFRLVQGHHFLKRVMEGNKVFLVGDERELASRLRAATGREAVSLQEWTLLGTSGLRFSRYRLHDGEYPLGIYAFSDMMDGFPGSS